MKIAINLLQYTDTQGIEIYAKNLLASILRNDKKDIFVLYLNPKSAEIFYFHGENIIRKEVRFRKLSKARLLIYQQLVLPFSLIKDGIDLLYCPSIAMPILYGKKIVTILDCASSRFKEEAGLLSRIYIKLAFLSSKFNSKKVITISNFAKKEIADVLKIREDKILVAYAGVPSLPVVAQSDVEKILDRFDLRIGQEVKKYFLYVGNFRPRKNIVKMINAFNLLCNDYDDIYFILAGKVEQRFFDPRVEIDEKNIQGKIKYFGVISEGEKYALYKNSFALSFCSLYEGFGLPILEAQSLGIPVLTSNTSSLSEVAGDSALLVEASFEKEIFAGMKKLADDEDLRRALIDRGKINLQRFSWDIESQKIINLFNNF